MSPALAGRFFTASVTWAARVKERQVTSTVFWEFRLTNACCAQLLGGHSHLHLPLSSGTVLRVPCPLSQGYKEKKLKLKARSVWKPFSSSPGCCRIQRNNHLLMPEGETREAERWFSQHFPIPSGSRFMSEANGAAAMVFRGFQEPDRITRGLYQEPPHRRWCWERVIAVVLVVTLCPTFWRPHRL